MKKKFLIAAGGLMVCAAVAIGINLSAKAKMSPLMLANLEALTQNEDGGDGKYDDYYNRGEYIVTRTGEGGLKLTDEEWVSFNITTDVVLVTYYNDCVYKKRRTCHEDLRTMPPVILYSSGQ